MNTFKKILIALVPFAGLLEAESVTMGVFANRGVDDDAVLSGLSATGFTITYTDEVSGTEGRGGVRNDIEDVLFSKVGDKLIYSFTYNSIVTSISKNNVLEAGFNFTNNFCIDFVTGYGSATDGRVKSVPTADPFTGGTVVGEVDFNFAEPSLTFSTGNTIDVTIELTLVGIDGSDYDYRVDVTYTSMTETSTLSRTVSDIGSNTVQLLYHVINDNDVNVEGDTWSVKNATLSYESLAAPFTLEATAQNGAVALDWDDSEDPSFDSFTVYRSEEGGANFVAVASGLTQSAYTDTGVANGTNYYYVVTETRSGEESSYGNEVFATPGSGSLIKYDLSLLDNFDGTPYNTRMTYPDPFDGGFFVMDPSDNVGRMDRMGKCVFGEGHSRAKIQTQVGLLHAKENHLGFTGSDVLNKEASLNNVLFKNSGTIYYAPLDTIFWLGREKDDEFDNQTAFNDMAYGLIITDTDDNGIASAGDVLELVSILYSTGTESVFGKTADQLTAIINFSPEVVGLTAQMDDSNNVILDWDDSLNPDVAFYTVYRSDESGSNYISVASGLTQSTYTDNGLLDGTTYYYVVTQTDSRANESELGDEVTPVPFVRPLAFPSLNTNYPIYSQLYSDVQIGNDVAAGKGLWSSEAPEALAAAYAYMHPQSSHRGDPAFLARLKVLLAATFDGWNATSRDSDLRDIGYCFQMTYAYALLKHYRSDVLTEDEISDWDAAMVRFADHNLSYSQLLFDDHILADLWLNGHIRLALGVYFAGVATGNSTYQTKAQQAIDIVMTQAVAGDGATHYVGFNNEAATYHGESIKYMLWWWLMTDSPEMKAALDKTIPYVPLSVEPAGFLEQSTAISYKHMYNGIRGQYAALLKAYLYGDRYNYYFGQDVEDSPSKIYELLLAILYRGPMTALTPPTDFILYDRAIMGPRGRWADWAFVATGRDVQSPEPEHADQGYDGRMTGKNTFVGAMALGAFANNTPLKGALDGVAPEFKRGTGVTNDWARSRSDDGMYRFLSQDENTSTITRNEFGTLATSYRLSERVSSNATSDWGAGTDWLGEQLWLLTGDRLVGLVQIRNETAASVYGLDTRIVLTGGRKNIIGQYYDLVETSSNEYEFAELRLRIGENTFGGPRTIQRVGMQNSAGDDYGAILRLHDAADSADDTLIQYPAGTRRWAVIECTRDGRSFANSLNNVHENDNNVAVLEVREADRSFYLIQNLTASARNYTGNFTGVADTPATLHRSWTDSVDIITPEPGNAIAINVDLPPYGHAIVVSGAAAANHSENQNHYENIFPETAASGMSNYLDWIYNQPSVGGDIYPDGDPDGDGIANLIEYGFGGDPADPANWTIQQPTLTIVGANAAFSYPRLQDSEMYGLSYSVEVCDDLASGVWETNSVLEPSFGEINSEFESVTHLFSIMEKSRAFFRVRIELVP
ncbi:hypothetical protein [Rubellicoccus peritrichatus]|uniref:Fibronectin type III domain protein n=1 Tax=Rubellicoccus peritrichatus TaxID=3080537 RepID=A0AAQ3QV83_9BACT|nr:hypothetical protein [Puniceicoccus sp. CR14]WOO43186.1 hypothetical protein RZN69_08775 [Puniceicoccus sp. CR14]